MSKNLLQNLKEWRAREARRENVELFRVISNQALEEIAAKKPQSKGELLEIKGIKEKKYAKYGEDILAMVRGEGEDFVESFKEEDKIISVSEYLDFVNENLEKLEARIKGEVSSVKFHGNSVYFSIKDKEDESILDCYMWSRDYEMSGTELEIGMEVVLWGYPNVYKPNGRISFRTKLIELIGEGALKKAYEELKLKLSREGLFLPDRKKPLAKYIKNIGLITSNQGAVIKDFLTNIGQYGFNIKFIDSRVEGKQAIFNLINAIKWFNKNIPDLDVLVIIRGGGSLESLQAFNSESVVRAVADSKIPVLCGIGHDTDETLIDLVSDISVSTPSIVTNVIRKTWDEAIHGVESSERYILNAFQNILVEKKNIISETERMLSGILADIFERFRLAKEKLKNNLVKIKMTIDQDRNFLSSAGKKLFLNYARLFSNFVSAMKSLAEKIAMHNPERQLKLGYSLVFSGKKILRSVKDVEVGDEVDVKLSDGELKSKITSVIASEAKQSRAL